MDNYEDFEFKVKDLNFYNYTKRENEILNICDTCSNNPKNGGSGICNCTLCVQGIIYC